MLKTCSVVVLSAIALAGCQSARGQGESFMSDAEIQAKDDGICRQFGAQPGTQVYVDCRLRLQSNRSAEQRASDMGAAMIMSTW